MVKKNIYFMLIMLLGGVLAAAEQNLILDPQFKKISGKSIAGQWKSWTQKACRIQVDKGTVSLVNEAKNKVSTVTLKICDLTPGGEYLFEVEFKSFKSRAWGKVSIITVKKNKRIKLAETKPLIMQEFTPVKLKFKMPDGTSSATITLLRSTWWGDLGCISFRKPLLTMLAFDKNKK